ncbi:MAG TPA: 16S rRNA (adenine(1518)-N(6)/adenine(1519)-N(6))-dimethyltransferase RsmA [Anaerolineales bacterium]
MTFPHQDAAAVLRRHGIHARRGLGQNFLDEPQYLERIVEAADLSKTDTVLEIGCGLGALTRHLAQAARRVVAVEIDGRLADIARASLDGFTNAEIVQGDILDMATTELGLPEGFVVAANIPYYVTSPILRLLLETEPGPKRIVLTVQKEVGARLCAGPPNMSLLSVSVQVYGSPRIVFGIPAAAFYPVPNVDSVVVRIDCYDPPPVSPSLLPALFAAARAGFSQRRKILRNTLSSGLGISTKDGQALLQAAGVDFRRRPQTVSIEEWARIAQVLLDRKS